MSSDLAIAWATSCRITLALLESIPEEALADRYSKRTRTVAAQFKHLHYLRVHNLKRRGPAFLGDLESFEKGSEPTKDELRVALEASGEALTELLEEVETEGKVRSWSGPPSTYLGYLVAHEAHHRALAIVALRHGGHKLSSDVTYGLWYEWRRRREGS